MDRQGEIAAKKAKIAELKRLREERERNITFDRNDSSRPSSSLLLNADIAPTPEVADVNNETHKPEPVPQTAQAASLATVFSELYKVDSPVRISTTTQTEAIAQLASEDKCTETLASADNVSTKDNSLTRTEEETWKSASTQSSKELIAFIQSSLHAISRARRGVDPLPPWCNPNKKSSHDPDHNSSSSLRKSFVVTPKSSIISLSSDITRGAVLCLSWHEEYNLLAICRAGASCIEIWDTKSEKTLEEPEWTLNCPAEIYSCMFSRDETFRLFAATNSGQLIMWELGPCRQNVVSSSRSLINLENHKSVMASLIFMKGVVSSYLMTLDLEGTALFWSQDLIARPVERMDLTGRPQNKASGMPHHTATSQNNSTSRYTCGAADPEAEGHFVAGTMTGEIYRCKKADRYGSLAGVDDSLPPFPAPKFPVPVLHLEYRETASDRVAGDALVLASGGLDWCVSLWSVFSRDSPSYNIPPRLVKQIVLDDIVSGIQWGPGCASLLAISVGKKISIWNFLTSCEQPLSLITLDCAITKLSWSKPTTIAVGLVDGTTQLLEVSADIIAQAQAPVQWSATFKLLST